MCASSNIYGSCLCTYHEIFLRLMHSCNVVVEILYESIIMGSYYLSSCTRDIRVMGICYTCTFWQLVVVGATQLLRQRLFVVTFYVITDQSLIGQLVTIVTHYHTIVSQHYYIMLFGCYFIVGQYCIISYTTMFTIHL